MSIVASQALSNTRNLIDTGIVTLASIAWADVIQTLIALYNPLGKDSIKSKVIYAVIVTVIVVLYTTYSGKIFKKRDDETDEMS